MRSLNFYLEHPIRELDQAALLQATLKYYNINLYVFSSVYGTNRSFLKNSNGAISPWGQGNHEYDYLFSIPEKINNGFKKIILWQENLLSKQNLPRILPRGKMINSVDAHITWGEKFARSLVEIGVPRDIIYICGSPRSDLLSPLFSETVKSKIDLAKEFIIPFDNNWILFSGSFKLNFITKSIRKIKLNQGFHDIDNHIEYTNLLFKNSMDLLKNFSIANPDVQIIVRPHPSEPLEVYKKIFTGINNIHIVKKYPIHHWINAVDLVFSTKSTSSLESFIMGTKAALIELPEMTSGEKDTFDFLKYFPKVNNHNEFYSIFKKAITLSNQEYYGSDYEKLVKYIQDGYGFTDGLNFLRVAYLLNTLLNESVVNRNKRLPFSVYWGLLKDQVKKMIIKYPLIGKLLYMSYHENRKHDYFNMSEYQTLSHTYSKFISNIELNKYNISLKKIAYGNTVDIIRG